MTNPWEHWTSGMMPVYEGASSADLWDQGLTDAVVHGERRPHAPLSSEELAEYEDGYSAGLEEVYHAARTGFSGSIL